MDLIGRDKHRFPNLVCMKLSGYYKELGAEVELKTDYEDLAAYDKVFISKVFTDTPIDEEILKLPNVEYGGTGFFYDKAPKLPDEVEHHMPDYHLYDEWVNEQIESGKKRNDFKYYLDYSLGYTTRGCFRQCEFCVNRNYKKVDCHSPLSEFLDPSRKKICLLDDNILGSPHWREIFEELHLLENHFSISKAWMRDFLRMKNVRFFLKVSMMGIIYLRLIMWQIMT